MKRIFLFISFLFFNGAAVEAQSIYEIDMKLSALLQNIRYWDEYDYHDRTAVTKDSLDKANDRLYNYLFRVCLKNPETIKEDLPKAKKNGMTIVSSLDHKLRLYAWDSRMGGSTRYYENIAQYQTPDGIKVLDLKDSTVAIDNSSNYRGITTVYTLARKTIYLVCDYRITANKMRYESVTAYTIDSGVLKEVSIFKTKKGQFTTIGYSYDPVISDRRFPLKETPVIHLSDNRQKLYIPIVKADEITGRYLVYVFDGEHFVFHKNEE